MSDGTLLPPDLIARLRAARRVTVLSGAGMSAESGIPTFRDAMTGLWARYRPEDLATPAAYRRDPALVWRWYAWRRRLVNEAEPNAGHLAVAELEHRIPAVAVVTQNVDGLHRRAGSTDVIELHGNLTRSRCVREGTVFERWTEADPGPPACPSCGGPLRPDVVWFGEALSPAVLADADARLEGADLVFSIGTSNVVEPAASMPWQAAARGIPVAVINVSLEGQRAGPGIFHVRGAAGTVMPALLAAAWPPARGEVGSGPDRPPPAG